MTNAEKFNALSSADKLREIAKHFDRDDFREYAAALRDIAEDLDRTAAAVKSQAVYRALRNSL